MDRCRPSCGPSPSPSAQQDSSHPAGGAAEPPAKLSGQRSYLQSLERSSRAWVLSSGKSQAAEEACGAPEPGGSNIWYNPIPEEEDAPRRQQEAPREQEEVWRRRGEAEGSAEPECPAEGANPSVSHHADDITAEHTGESASRCGADLKGIFILNCYNMELEYKRFNSYKSGSITSGPVTSSPSPPSSPAPLGVKPRLPEERGRVRQRNGQAAVSGHREETLPEDEETSRAATEAQPALVLPPPSPRQRQPGRGRGGQ